MKKIRWVFKKVGMGYMLESQEAGVELTVGRLKRTGQELHCEIEVRVRWEGVKTVNGTLHMARFNMSSVTSRSTLAKHLKGRTENAEGDWSEMDWGDALEHLCQYVSLAERESEPVVSLDGEMPAKRTKYDVDPMCPHGVTSILYGPGGIGKSIVAMAMALSVALGKEIVPGFTPTIKGRALYLDYETDHYVARERVEHISKGHQFKPTADLFYRRCTRPLADDVEEISRLVAEKDIKFIVIDSAGPAMGASKEHGDANESTVKLFNATRFIGATTLMVDHVSKMEMKDRKGEVQGRLPYGSVYKVNLARATWELENMTGDDDDDIMIRILNTKANDARLHEPMELSITWESAQGVIAFSDGGGYEPQLEAFAATADGKTDIQFIVDLVANHGPMTTREVADALGKKPAYIRSVLTKHSNLIQRDLTSSKPHKIRLVRSGGI